MTGRSFSHWLKNMSGVRFLCLILGFVLLAAFAGAKAPPDWTKPFLTADIPELWRDQPAIQLVDWASANYTTETRVRRLQRGAIRITTEKGRMRATCYYSYNADNESVLSAQAWIISKDGKKSVIFSMRNFADRAAQVGQFFWPQQRVLSFEAGTGLEIGGVLAWEFIVESQSGLSDINWSFAHELPVAVSQLDVAPLPGGRLQWHPTGGPVRPPTAGPTAGSLHWEEHQITPPVGDRPNGFYPTPFSVSVRAVKAGSIPTWASFAQLATEVIEPRIVATSEIKSKAVSLIAGKITRWDRIRALTEFVQNEITYLAITLDRDYLAGYRPHLSGEVLQNRYGDCKDKAALLVALLRSVGDDGRVVLVYAGNPSGVQPDWPAACFNHAIVGIPADDDVPSTWPSVAGYEKGLVLFDPTDSQTPLGGLSQSISGGWGLVASPRTTRLIALPTGTAAANHSNSRVNAAIDSAGTFTAQVVETAMGRPAVQLHAMREQLRNEKFGQSLEARLHENAATVRDLKWTDLWDPKLIKWQLNFEFNAQRHLRRIGGTLLLLNPFPLSSNTRLTPWKTNQDGVVSLGAGSSRQEIRLQLPDHFVVEELPDDWHEQIGAVSGHLKYRTETQTLICESVITFESQFLDRLSYESVRNVVQKMQEAQRRPIVVRDKSGFTAPP